MSTTTPHVLGTPNALESQATGGADMAKEKVEGEVDALTNSAKDGGASASGELGADVDADAEVSGSVH